MIVLHDPRRTKLLLVICLIGIQLVVAEKRNPVRIFIVAGDGAAEGYSSLSELKELSESNPDRYGHLRVDESEANQGKSLWKVRDDVFVSYQGTMDKRWQHKPLSADMGLAHSSEYFGPEVELGFILGEIYEEPVVIVKCAWNGKSLANEFRPPSAGGSTGVCDTPLIHLQRYYKQILSDVKRTIKGLGDVLMGQALKDYRRAGHRIEGLVWWHGYSDLETKEYRENYTENLKFFMSDIRKDLGVPYLPIVVGELGGMGTRRVTLFEHNFRVYQERAVKADATSMSRFVKTHDKLEQTNIGFDHVGYEYYYHQAAFMVKLGAAFAEGLLVLMNADDDTTDPVDAAPFTIDEAASDFQRYQQNKQNKILLIFGALLMGSVLVYAVILNRATRDTLGSSLREGWNRTMAKLRPAVRAVVPTDDDGNLVLGVMVVPTNAVAESASQSLAYVDHQARSTYAYVDETVRSLRIPEIQIIIKTPESTDNSVVQVDDTGSDLEAEMVAA